MEGAEILPGEFSQVGRVTGKTLEQLRSFCDLSEPSPKATGLRSQQAQPPEDGAESPEASPMSATQLLAQTFGRSKTRKLGGTRMATTVSTVSTDLPSSPEGASSPMSYTASTIRPQMTTTPQGMTTMATTNSAVRRRSSVGKDSTVAATVQVLKEAEASPAAADLDGDAVDKTRRMSRKQRIAIGEEEPMVKEEVVKQDIAFTSQGPDAARPCEKTRYLLGRFAAPMPKEEAPEVGRYKPLHTCVTVRYPQWNFGEQPKHPSRKVHEPDINTRDPFHHIDLDAPAFSFSAQLVPPEDESERKSSPLALASPWNDAVGRFGPVRMTQVTGARDWHLHDVASSKRIRQPEPRLDVAGRKNRTCESFFEPGKYPVAEQRIANRGPEMARALNRAQSAGQLGRAAPKDIFRGDDKPMKSLRIDRSLYRAGSQTCPRITHVSDFKADLSRPPLMPPEPVYYDEADPEVSAAWLQRQLTFDASSCDHAVIPRGDRAPDIASAMKRGTVKGCRLHECDVGMVRAQGRGFPDPLSASTVSIDKAKAAPSNTRRDLCVKNFSRYASREKTRESGEYSSLRRPRSMAAPDFERTARSGFTTRTPLSPKSRRSSAGEAAAAASAVAAAEAAALAGGWAAELFDESEAAPPPGSPTAAASSRGAGAEELLAAAA